MNKYVDTNNNINNTYKGHKNKLDNIYGNYNAAKKAIDASLTLGICITTLVVFCFLVLLDRSFL
jgi:hypothetical protein